MTLEEKLTAFTINEAAWIVWLLVGLSMGVTVALTRAIALVLSSSAVQILKVRAASLCRLCLYGRSTCPSRSAMIALVSTSNPSG